MSTKSLIQIYFTTTALVRANGVKIVQVFIQYVKGELWAPNKKSFLCEDFSLQVEHSLVLSELLLSLDPS